ncbi:hypothetical protein [Arthrobacter caoxuetaonis]|uniref:Uncharacterized protein n=1 Tax=Arthrobacter caoxuetaonis TaxID=2886935 RepID=A0A9X1SD17_9MICC|nr:hypothetical protein [Arthrobacter caoxuetaonis]MCC3299245.1 hypothetical protein [Arthrobacter caoxuetaonis]USQ59261.1 hypothetical protein NF551_16895 [Arthrobacter caoxuetaonis]
MIPQPVSLVPLAVIVILAVGALAYAAFKAGTGAARSEPGSKARLAGFTVTGVAMAAALGGLAMMANILLTHEAAYEAVVWVNLYENYGIAPAAGTVEFMPGVPFEAILDGEAVSCTVIPPGSVDCDGETVLPLAEGVQG